MLQVYAALTSDICICSIVKCKDSILFGPVCADRYYWSRHELRHGPPHFRWSGSVLYLKWLHFFLFFPSQRPESLCAFRACTSVSLFALHSLIAVSCLLSPHFWHFLSFCFFSFSSSIVCSFASSSLLFFILPLFHFFFIPPSPNTLVPWYTVHHVSVSPAWIGSIPDWYKFGI